tara:strand:- start:3640 stop:4977 length:1338 start_codon:yes stop_codon:yes gene_type:complete
MSHRLRFAPSPTGLIHIGNARSAALNWAYAKSKKGDFILRIDDTDIDRSKKEYEIKIKNDLKWLGIDWKSSINQSNRKNIYDQYIEKLKSNKRLYPCFESSEELALKKKSLLTSGKPPIYDRNSLNLSTEEINELIKSGKKPHWRFKLNHEKISWNDLIKGEVTFDCKNLSDPVLIREDGTLLYHLPSVVDDIDLEITDIIRGEDHITNTAFHIQIFDSLNAKIPSFGHHPFLTDHKGKGFAKRLGSLSIEDLRNEGFERFTILNYLLSIGSSLNLTKEIDEEILTNNFDIKSISNSSPKFSFDTLKALNKDILKLYNYSDIKNRFSQIGIKNSSEHFWELIKNNVNYFSECLEWDNIINSTEAFNIENTDFLKLAAELLPDEPFDNNTWDQWISLIKEKTKKSGKDLFIPLRIALTGKESGPELKFLLPFLSKDNILKKFGIIT